jgi:hypothetical protein
VPPPFRFSIFDLGFGISDWSAPPTCGYAALFAVKLGFTVGIALTVGGSASALLLGYSFFTKDLYTLKSGEPALYR